MQSFLDKKLFGEAESKELTIHIKDVPWAALIVGTRAYGLSGATQPTLSYAVNVKLNVIK
jgi:hypothetical protein